MTSLLGVATGAAKTIDLIQDASDLKLPRKGGCETLHFSLVLSYSLSIKKKSKANIWAHNKAKPCLWCQSQDTITSSHTKHWYWM